MAHSILSGKGGAVNGVPCVGDWNISHNGPGMPYGASNTHGGKGRVLGNADWTGSFNMFGFLPPELPGHTFTFTGSIDGTNGATGAAIVNSVSINLDFAGGGPIVSTVNFGSCGALTLGASAATDATTPAPATARNGKVQWHATSPVDIEDVQSAVLTITADNKTYVDSGIVKRVAGPIDATLVCRLLEADPAIFPAIGTDQLVKLYCTAALYWELKWMHVDSISDLAIPINAGDIVGASVNMSMNGFNVTDGYIKTPEAVPTTFWPA